MRIFKKCFYVIRLRLWALPVLVLILSMAAFTPSFEVSTDDPYPDFYAENAPPADGISPAEKTVFLTFDDGPSAVTDEILDTLKEKGVPATFFVIGPKGELTEERLLRIVNEGHDIGLHSYCHKYDEIYASVDSFLADLSTEQDWLEAVLGSPCSIFRFPGGSANSLADKSIVTAVKDEMSRRGFVWYDWNADSEDSIHKYISSGEIISNVFACAKGKNTVVVLLHDSVGHKATAEALPYIIDGFSEQGYCFGRLSEMQKPLQY